MEELMTTIKAKKHMRRRHDREKNTYQRNPVYKPGHTEKKKGKWQKINQKKYELQAQIYKKEGDARYRKYKEDSFQPPTDWTQIMEISTHAMKQIPLYNLKKLGVKKGTSNVRLRAGQVGHFKEGLTSVTGKKPFKLVHNETIDDLARDTISVRTDENFYEIFDDEDDKISVIISDNVLATIMGMNKSKYSWDIIVEIEDDLISFDIRGDTDHTEVGDKEDNFLDFQTVGETSTTHPPKGKIDEKDASSV